MFELRKHDDADLIGDEWNEHQGERYDTRIAVPTAEAPQAALGRHAEQTDDDEQIQPGPTRSARFVERQDERGQRDQARHGAEQTPGAGRDDQHEKDIEQTPTIEPRAVDDIRSGRHEPITGRQMQGRLNSGEGFTVTGDRDYPALRHET